MTLQDLENKYSQIPLEIKNLRRWICYNIEIDNETGEKKKTPRNAITGGYARSNDPLTWTSFDIALLGCIKYGFVGLGFMLGEDTSTGTRYFGIDLDNHEDKVTGEKPMTKEEFVEFAREFINGLNSYTEYSHSGQGVHIICKGNLPEGFFDIFHKLKENGIKFVVASGRPYYTLYENFKPISDELYYICDNGSCIAEENNSTSYRRIS